MTHRMQTTALDQVTELLAENGFDGLASAVTVLLNEVMKIELAHALGGVLSDVVDRRMSGGRLFPHTVHEGGASDDLRQERRTIRAFGYFAS